MSAPRFKSKDDYFSHRSNLTEQIIQPKQQAKRKGPSHAVAPVSLIEDVFCGTVESYEVEGEGRFERSQQPIEDALARHLEGDATVLVNPIDRHGMSAWHLVDFSLSGDIAHPFSKAREFADALDVRGIPSLVEVAEGGKGYYHLWILHEKPVEAGRISDILRRFGLAVLGYEPDVIPSDGAERLIPLPLQYESVLLQRRVFVNTVGKKVKDQRALLEQAGRASQKSFDALMQNTVDIQVSEPAPPVMHSADKPGSGGIHKAHKTSPLQNGNNPRSMPTPEKHAAPEKSASLEHESIIAEPDHDKNETPPAPQEDAPKIIGKPEPKQTASETSTVIDEIPAEHIPSTPKTRHSIVPVLRFTYGLHHFALPAENVVKVETWDSGDDERKPAGMVHFDGEGLPVIYPDIFGEDIPGISAIIVAAGHEQRFILPASGVEGVIRVTLERTGAGDHPQLMGKAAFGETSIGVLDPSRLRGRIPQTEVRPAPASSGEHAPDMPARYLVFSVSGKTFAADASRITEILGGSAVRRIPAVRGGDRLVAETGGSYLPVTDLAARLEMERASRPASSRILVIDAGGTSAGVQVDGIEGFITAQPHEIRSLPPDTGEWFSKSIEKAGNGAILVIDVDNLEKT